MAKRKKPNWKDERTCEVCGGRYYPNSHNQKSCGAGCAKQRMAEQFAETNRRGRFVVFHRDEFCCIYCGRSPVVDEHVVLHLEHVVPKYDEGEDRLSNLATACSRCNLEKGRAALTESVQQKILGEIERRNEAGGLNPRTIIKTNP